MTSIRRACSSFIRLVMSCCIDLLFEVTIELLPGCASPFGGGCFSFIWSDSCGTTDLWGRGLGQTCYCGLNAPSLSVVSINSTLRLLARKNAMLLFLKASPGSGGTI